MDFALILIGRFLPKGKRKSDSGCAPRSQCSIRSFIVLSVLAGQASPAVLRQRVHTAPRGLASRWLQVFSSIWRSVPRLGRSNPSRRPNPRPTHNPRSRSLFRRAWLPPSTFSRSAESFPAIVPSPARSRLTVSAHALSARTLAASPQATTNNAASATWQPLGPTAVLTPNFGLVTGRITAIALDPSDATGNHLYIGTTGGGVWSSSNAGTSTVSNIVFNPLTDAVTALGGAVDASISIGALTVQPGATGVILAGTGDPNDVLDSYYGAGILRSTDGGNTWSLIQGTADVEDNLGNRDVNFAGEGFAGFAWSTVNPQLVVAAVSQSYEGDAGRRRRACA